MKKVLSCLAGLLSVFVVFALLLSPNSANALSLSLDSISGGTFGGTIKSVTYCTCLYNPGVVLEINDAATNDTINVFYSKWFSTLHQNYNIWKSGPSVLGGYSSGGKCMDQATYYCKPNTKAPSPIKGTIDWVVGIGTSIK